ncbi:DUF1367 family protein [Herminiimonas sp. CN]|uniref:DUF1367 family protein n=1 Tax=Herminiimonas sp. CN TaxID=1349818 RepID=UPI0004741A54|nr:DUF1367 family protein [Herminiimonas sp. CN]
MPTVTLTRNDQGKVAGTCEKNQRAYARFVKRMQSLTHQSTLVLKWWEPRSPKFHRFHFAILGDLFKSQDQFDDDDAMRKWLEIGAGYCQMVPGPTGKMCAMPKSIAYEKLDDVEFQEVHAKVRKFMRSTHATRFLWPALDDMQGLQMVDAVLDKFDLG